MMQHRRGFLRSLGLGAGATFMSPLLSRAYAQAGQAPRRIVIVVEGNGIEPIAFLSPRAREAIQAAATGAIGQERWFFRRYGHEAPLEVAGDLNQALALGPLGALQEKAVVVLGLSSRVTGGGHSTNGGALSCTRSSSARTGGPTIDSVLARHLRQSQRVPFDALRVGITRGADTRLIHTLCASGRNQPLPVITRPELAYDLLFGSVASPESQARFGFRTRLLDFAATDVSRALSLFPGNSSERAKLERYLSGVEELQERQGALVASESELRAYRPEDPRASAPRGDAVRRPLDELAQQFKLAEAALLGGLTNVVVVGSGTGGGGFNIPYASLREGEVIDRHDLHHGSKDSPSSQALIHGATRRHVELVADLAGVLDAQDEAGGTMLDNTAILYMSDNGEHHHSSASEWPMLLVGGGNLGLRTGGRTVVYPTLGFSGHRQVSNMFNTLGQAAGLELSDFGGEGDGRVAQGELSELFS